MRARRVFSLRRPALAVGLAALLAWPVHAQTPQNRLQNADFSRLKAGAPPPKPWRTSGKAAGVEVVAGAPEGKGSGWIRLRDDSAEGSATLRQNFAPLTAGSFSLRIRTGEKNAAALGIYLGAENASSAAERVIDIKANARGVLQIGTAGDRERSPITLSPGSTTWFFVQWRPSAAGDNLDVVYGTLDEKGRVESSQRLDLPVAPRAISALRVTTDNSATGADYHIAALHLTTL